MSLSWLAGVQVGQSTHREHLSPVSWWHNSHWDVLILARAGRSHPHSAPWHSQSAPGTETWVRCHLRAQRSFMIYHGCSSNARIQPLWNIFLCVYFSPKLHKACVTAQVPSGSSSQVKRLSLQVNHGNLCRSNYSALTDTNYKLQALKSLHNPYCAYGTSTLSHWDTKIYREDRNKRWQNLHTFPQNINYSVILKTHEQQSGFPQFCGIKVFDSLFWV